MEERKERWKGSSGERRDLSHSLHASGSSEDPEEVSAGKDDGGEDLLNQTSLVLLLCGAWSLLYSGAHPGFQANPTLLLPMLLAPHSPFHASTLQAPFLGPASLPLLYSSESCLWEASCSSQAIHSFPISPSMHCC